jgi:hypothetical protein
MLAFLLRDIAKIQMVAIDLVLLDIVLKHLVNAALPFRLAKR